MSSDRSRERVLDTGSSLPPDTHLHVPEQFLLEEIQALPYSDITSALTLAAHKLELVNRLRIDATHREEAVRPFIYAWRKFHSYYAERRTTQASVRQPDTSELDHYGTFNRSLSYGYQLALEELLGLENQHSQKAQLFYNAIFFIGQAMLHAYTRYSWVEPGLWQQLHALLRGAELEKCEEIAVSSPLDFACKQSIKQLYAQICMLSVADPYHLQQGDVWFLQRYLVRWGQCIGLTIPDLERIPEFCFCVNLYSQIRPFPLTALKNPAQDGLRWLLVDKLEQLITHHLNLLRNGHATAVLEAENDIPPVKAADLLERALVSWIYTPSRQSARTEENSAVGVVWTLNDIYQLLDAHARQTTEPRKLRLTHKAWGTTENVSDSGVRVHVKTNSDNSLAVGDVLGLLLNTPQGQKLRVGIVQWTAQGESEQQIRCGIQYISGTPCAAWVDAGEHELAVRQGILLVQEDGLTSSNSLLLPAGMTALGEKVVISTPEVSDAFEIRLTRYLMQTDQIDHFSFETVNELA